MTKLQRGVGLIEVLVAIFILGVGVLGFSAMQMKALQSSDSSYYRAQAIVLAADIVSRITVSSGQVVYSDSSEAVTYGNKAEIVKAFIDGMEKASLEWSGTYINPSEDKQILDAEPTLEQQKKIAEWEGENSAWEVANLLPNGSSLVAENDDGHYYQVIVAWNETDAKECNSVSIEIGEKDCVKMEVVP